MAFGFHFGAQIVCIGDITVVGDCNLAPFTTHENRLRVCKGGCACGAVTHVPDACKAVKFINVVFPEKGRYKSHGLADANLVSIGDRESGTFLPAVLQGVKPHGNIPYDSVAIVNADHSAFFVQFVEHNASLKCMLPLPRRS